MRTRFSVCDRFDPHQDDRNFHGFAASSIACFDRASAQAPPTPPLHDRIKECDGFEEFPKELMFDSMNFHSFSKEGRHETKVSLLLALPITGGTTGSPMTR
ncbi:hypothetical protein [Paraburkholderia sp. 2C]